MDESKGHLMDNDRLPHLETFATAAELSSFTAAAKALHLTQAAVSQRIAALESDLGVSLFRRQGGRVLLTEAGQRLHGYARRILDLHREARQEVAGRPVPLTGELSLAASSVPGEHLLPQLLAIFQQRHPHIRVHATVADSEAVLSRIERGQAHLGLVGMKSDSPHLDYRCFACDTLALIVPARHPWVRRKQVSLAQLAEQPLIVREAGSGSRWCLEQALRESGKSLSDLRVALELGSNEAIKEAVFQGLGVTVLSTHAVENEVRAGRLHALTIRGLPLLREMFAVWDRRRVLPIPTRLFLDLLEPCKSAETP
ncbi:MAG: selenium metabolism-associated LysR family transcriptional regulator [Gemmataceae bacterium]